MNLLSVDWDYFFPTPMKDALFFDWGHREEHLFMYESFLWRMRAETFLQNDRPLPMTSGDETTFWDKFLYSEDVELYLCESHRAAAYPEVMEGITEVWNYDAHHDCGYHGEASLEEPDLMESWMLSYMLKGARCHVRYPGWLETGLNDERIPEIARNEIDIAYDCPEEDQTPVFDRIFLCRSAAWVPPWLDEAFVEFVMNAPVERFHWFGDEKNDPMVPRDFPAHLPKSHNVHV